MKPICDAKFADGGDLTVGDRKFADAGTVAREIASKAGIAVVSVEADNVDLLVARVAGRGLLGPIRNLPMRRTERWLGW